MEKIFPSNYANLRCGLSKQEYLSIFLDPSVSGINWDTSKQEVRVQMKSRISSLALQAPTRSLTLQEYRDERVVNEFIKQIEGDNHET
jgi:hypothetical protein